MSVSAAKGSAAPTTALAGSAGLPSPEAAAGVFAAGEVAAGTGEGAAAWRSLPIHQPAPMAPAKTTTPATASHVLLIFPLTANPSALLKFNAPLRRSCRPTWPRASRYADTTFLQMTDSTTPPSLAASSLGY
ncbi:hypothetical protein G6F31_018236 [Rhizopus arrhizus]|nr:hypothetical protein G6F31_018236 [Rhizopus arrhizus]